MRPLSLFFKKLLRSCSLSDPFSGGFGSYSTLLLVRAYMMLSNAHARSLSPAAALAEMCAWVADFDWRQRRIVWREGAPAVEHIGAALLDACVWIGDPVNGNGNVARASFQFGDVARLCRDAVQLLMYVTTARVLAAARLCLMLLPQEPDGAGDACRSSDRKRREIVFVQTHSQGV